MLRKREKEHRLEKRKGFNFSFKLLFIFVFLVLFFFISHFTEELIHSAQAEEALLQEEQIISLAEDKIFHEKYSNEKLEDRLSRIESFIFGKKFSDKDASIRISKISQALDLSKKEVTITPPEIKPPEEKEEKQELKIIPEETNTGIIGTISKIENKVFHKTYNDIPFEKRISALETQVLTKKEIAKMQSKSLLERVTYLMEVTGIPPENQGSNEVIKPPPQNKNNYPNKNQEQSYKIDPQSGLIINEQTGESVQDSYGNPIKVKIPQQVPYYGQGQVPQNQFAQPYGNPFPYQAPYGNGNVPQQFGNPQQQFPGQFPYDLFLNPGGGGADPGY
ncbi:MAG: hypothetical protein A3B68_05775 [Candidatus Melainabacteria bacterium RIFCSPHIGHO2_02_FULL_34_12]|nr:MAG: hypothetical protein A3B68_05775 [Candidatus Melainabacteria bacterium RIFCSPHIGHO2_02_FULL_34_12]